MFRMPKTPTKAKAVVQISTKSSDCAFGWFLSLQAFPSVHSELIRLKGWGVLLTNP